MSSVFLLQTDTTVGFLSKDSNKLSLIKSRPANKNFITVYKDFKSLKESRTRIMQEHKNLIRRSKKTTFIIAGKSFRVAQPTTKAWIIKKESWFYSTSANQSGMKFDREFCESQADIVIENRDGLNELPPSNLIKLNKKTRRRLR